MEPNFSFSVRLHRWHMMEQSAQRTLKSNVQCNRLSTEVANNLSVAELIMVKLVFSPPTLFGPSLRTVTISQRSLWQTFIQLTLCPKEVPYWYGIWYKVVARVLSILQLWTYPHTWLTGCVSQWDALDASDRNIP